MISLWRDRPLCESKRVGKKKIHARYVFPSGRQALASALGHAGLCRYNRLALPEWSSGCVISAVGRVVTPLSLREVLEHGISVAAVLLYEQWGWPFPLAVHHDIRERFSNMVVVLDCVDSADVEERNRLDHYQSTNDNFFVIYSLSKLLGLRGGGIAKSHSGYLAFSPKEQAGVLSDHLWRQVAECDTDIYAELLHLHKSNVEYVHHDVQSWVASYEIVNSLSIEADRRRDHLKIIAESALAKKWPHWMHEAVTSGAAPGIVPLDCEWSLSKMQAIGKELRNKHGIDTNIYNFNWSGNPLAPDYHQCLAFPVHGELDSQHLREAVADML